VTLQPARHAPWLGGFLLSVNVYLMPQLDVSPRGTDLAAVLLGCWVVLLLTRGRLPAGPLAMAGVSALAPICWLFFGYLNGHMDTATIAFRLLLAVPWALALGLILDDEESLVAFARGLLVGGLVNVGVIILQWRGLEGILQMVGLSSSQANYHQYVAFTVRIPGLHGHHNASSAVASLLIPAGFYLYFKGKLKLPSLLGTLAAMLVALHLTSTRSPLIVGILTVVLASILARRLGRSVIIGFFLVSVLVPLVVVYGPPGGWARWKNTEALISNASEREESTLGAAVLSVAHPLGLGVKEGQKKLSEKTGIGATHNAFLQASLVFGMVFGLLVLWGVLSVVVRGIHGVDHPFFLPGLLAFHTAGLFMFEEHLNNPTFMILTIWFITLTARPALRTGKSPVGAPADSPE
jgi:uncharacterized membrane protein YhaH (DUF805 family)